MYTRADNTLENYFKCIQRLITLQIFFRSVYRGHWLRLGADVGERLKAEGYATPYLNRHKSVTAVGAAFNAEARTLKGWASELLAQ